MKQQRRISRRALVRRFVTACTIVGVISCVAGIIIGIIIGSHTNITAEAAVYRVSDGPGADIHITLNATEAAELETIEAFDESTVTVIETPTEALTEPQTQPVKIVQLSAVDEQMLLKLAMAEAEDQSTVGKALVMRVVLNRVASAKWPDNVHDVIFQAKQFEVISNGRYDRVTPNAACYEALAMIESGWDESQGAVYFCMAGESKWHEAHLTKLFQNGSHIFYK